VVFGADLQRERMHENIKSLQQMVRERAIARLSK
jgi:hypothetical protein